MKRITLFTFGYWGWGNATPELIQGVDAVERSRGFKPPLFVDTRIRRAGRALGFQGAAFEKLLGANRHRWIPKLGNKAILGRSGPGIQIADPSAANDLLELAVESAETNQRVLFFCGCPWPKWCHRRKVADLVLKAAENRRIPVEIVEWPGDEPRQLDLKVSAEIFAAARRCKWSVSLGKPPQLAKYAGLPWGSILKITSGAEAFHAISGPAKFERNEWNLPVSSWFHHPDAATAAMTKESGKERRSLGLEPRRSK